MANLKINDINKNFGSTEVLKGINLDINDGDFLVLLGPSGCGKTTLLKLIAGLFKVEKGEILLDNELVSSNNIHVKTEKRKIGFLFQDYALFPHQTVKENLQFAIRDKSSSHTIEEILDVIKLTDALKK